MSSVTPMPGMEVTIHVEGEGLPPGGNPGDVLTRTEGGAAWTAMEGGGAEILWVNPNPLTAIDEGNGISIPVDLSAYKCIQMLFRHSTSTYDAAIYSGYMLATGSDLVCNAVYGLPELDAKGNIVSRYASASVSYGNGALSYWGADVHTVTYGGTASNAQLESAFSGAAMVPLMVIGYK